MTLLKTVVSEWKRKRREPKPKTREQNKLLSCLEVVDERVFVAYGC